MKDMDSENSYSSSSTCNFDLNGAIVGFKRGIPIAISAFGTGMVFGILAQQAGLTPLEASLMSALVLSGTVQFVVIELWSTPLPTATIILTTLIVSFQYLLMSALLRPWFADLTEVEAYTSVFFITDSDWPLTITELKNGTQNGAFLLGSGIAVFSAWVSATAIGGMAGTTIDNPAQWGLDFAFIAVLVTLLVELYDEESNIFPLIVAGSAAVVTSWVVPNAWYVLVGGITGSTAEVIRRAN